MQILSLAGTALLAQALPVSDAPGSEQALKDFVQRAAEDWQQLTLCLAAALLVAFLSFWFASKPLDEDEEDGFVRALKVWCLDLLFITATAAVFGIVAPKYILPYLNAPVTEAASKNLFVAEIIGVIIVVVLVIAFFAIPMRVYKFRLGSAILYVLLAVVLMTIGFLGLRLAFSKPLARLNENVQDTMVRLGAAGDPVQSSIFQAKAVFVRATENAEKRATDRTRTVLERQQAIKEYYSHLENYRVTLNSTNPVGIAEYEKRKQRYEQILADLKIEAAAKKLPPAQ